MYDTFWQFVWNTFVLGLSIVSLLLMWSEESSVSKEFCTNLEWAVPLYGVRSHVERWRTLRKPDTIQICTNVPPPNNYYYFLIIRIHEHLGDETSMRQNPNSWNHLECLRNCFRCVSFLFPFSSAPRGRGLVKPQKASCVSLPYLYLFLFGFVEQIDLASR